MNRDFALYLLTENRDLLKRIVNYNGLDEEVKLPESIADSPVCENFKHNGRLLRKLSPVKSGYFDFENIANRLCFFSQESLARLSKTLSACICSGVLLAEIKKDKVIAYRNFLGDELYEFGLKRGSLFIPEYLKNKIVSLYPSKDSAVYESGMSALQTMLKGASKEIADRIILEENSSRVLNLEEGDVMVLVKCIVKVLCREIDPSCQNIFK